MDNEEFINLAAEDQFSVIDTYCPTYLFPHPFTIANFAAAANLLSNDWKFLWDFRGNNSDLTSDVIDAYEETVPWFESTLLVNPASLDLFCFALQRKRKQI